MYREKRRNKIIILVLVGIICLMGVGYAAFKTSINITGTTDISSSWDIKIISADVTDTNGTGENVKNTYNDLSASLEANLYEKGDYVEYSIIVENKGTFDAKLETIGITNSNNEAVKITSTGLTKGQTLYKNSTATLKVKIEYNSSYEGDASGTSGESTVDLEFTQNSGGTIEPTTDHLVTYDYTTNGGESTTAENAYIAEGESIDLSYTATKEGYDFVGWNTNKDAKEGLTELTMGTSDVTLYAIFKKPDDTPPIIENVSTSSTTNSITVVVTATDGESGISKYEFKTNDGDWIDNGTNNAYTFTGLTQNTGYNISVRVTNGIDLTTEEELSESIDLTNDVTTTGGGLYEDSYEEGRYVYKGANPNNYVSFNDELWRIIALENDGIMKIINTASVGNVAFDTVNNRLTAENTYCNEASTYGCQAWGAVDGTFTNAGGSISGTVTKDAYVNTYLNSDYYETLNTDAKQKINSHNFNIGIINTDLTNLDNTIAQEKAFSWQGNVGLINVSDYIKSSTNTNCTNTSVAYSSNVCKNGNYLYNANRKLVAINGRNNNSRSIVYAETSGKLNNQPVNTVSEVIPVIYLNNWVTLVNGDGTSNNPFLLSKGVSTSTLNKPIFSESGNKPKTVTITYPEGEGLTYEYQKDSGEWTTATQSQQVSFSESGTLVARVSDGTNTETATYTVKINGPAGSDLVDQAGVVDNGDGLYKDAYEENVYTYRGSNPNNYVMFNGESWRIISANTSDNTIKIIRTDILEDRIYDPTYIRKSDYCNNVSFYGCNIWGSNSTLYDVNMSPITTLAYETDGTAYALPTTEASLNIYLNETYYNSLSQETQTMIVDNIYKVGILTAESGQKITVDLEKVNSVKWQGKVALIDTTEYVRASTNNRCTGVYNSINGLCNRNNWMNINDIWWTLTPWYASSYNSSVVWNVTYNGLTEWYAAGSGFTTQKTSGVRPVVTLSPSVKITSGDGSEDNPYTLTI